jgi:prevent-host-death family protein
MPDTWITDLGTDGQNGHMRTTSLARAKANLSKIVDEAEHHGKRIVILRHGKPAAAVVPVAVAMPKPQRTRSLNPKSAERSVRRFIGEFSAVEPATSAVEDLLKGRR